MVRSTGGARQIWANTEATAARLGARHAVRLLRLSVGIVFLWFAIPKFRPGLSAVDTLAVDTISFLSLEVITGDLARIMLATLETAIGIGLLTGRFLRPTLVALLLQMMGTLTPLLLFPDQMWTAPFVPSLEGQFILKNLVLIAAGITIATVPGGGMLVSSTGARMEHRQQGDRSFAP